MVSVLGGDTPLGREVKEQIDSANLGVIVRTFTVGRGAPAVRRRRRRGGNRPLRSTRETLRNSLAVVSATDAAAARNARQLAGGDAGPAFVDLTYGLEGLPEARLRVGRSPVRHNLPATTNLYIVAHPAASALALILLPAARTLSRCVRLLRTFSSPPANAARRE